MEVNPDQSQQEEGWPGGRGENLQSIHDRDGVFNHFTYSWGGIPPP